MTAGVWDHLQVCDAIRTERIIAVIRTHDEASGRKLIQTVTEGGLKLVEVTLTTPGALDLIREFAGSEDFCVGAGTVMNKDAAAAVIDAGGHFVIAPYTDPETVAFCKEKEVVVIPGTLTPSEVTHAWALRPDFVKVFPIGPVGAAKYLRAIRGPLPDVPIIPTGGTNLDNVEELFAAGAVAVGVSDGLATPQDIRQGLWQEIGERAWALRASAQVKSP